MLAYQALMDQLQLDPELATKVVGVIVMAGLVSEDGVPTKGEWEAHKAFYDLTVLQRNAAWREVDQLREMLRGKS